MAKKQRFHHKKDSRIPTTLKDTESSSVQKFFEEYDLYKKEGEREDFVHFVDEDFLMKIS